MTFHPNRQGRQPGRGLRPWLLIPKVLSLGLLFGGMTSAAVLVHTAQPTTPGDWQSLVDNVGTIFIWLIVPAVLATLFFGLLLLLMHPRVFLGRRWLQVKLVVLAISLPVLHLSGRHTLHDMRRHLSEGSIEELGPLLWNLTCIMDAAVIFVAAAIVIGRHKPRLGQWEIRQPSSSTANAMPNKGH